MHPCHCFGPRNVEGKQPDAAASPVSVDQMRSVDEKSRWYLSVHDRMLGDGESGRSIGRGVCLSTLEPLAPNGNIQTASTRGERSVTRLWNGIWGESGQCAKIRMKAVTGILALGAIKRGCGRPWHMVGSLRT
jgi:hypothetical protein